LLKQKRELLTLKRLLTDTDNQGFVYKKTLGSYHVQADGRSIVCTISPRLRRELACTEAGSKDLGRRACQVKTQEHGKTVVVGDVVRFVEVEDGTGTIVEVLPRRNQLARRAARPSATAHAFEQVIVANLDQVVPVIAAAEPPPRWNLLDRYLVSAEAAGLPALVCITKLDLAQGKDGSIQAELWEAVEEYRRIGYAVLLASAVTVEGIEELRQALAGRTSAFLGKSGVGKTSLLNALQPGLGLRVHAISQATGKGKHTTTHLEMFPLEPEGYVVDTPGIREFGLWDVHQDDLALFFPEMRPFAGRCRFGLDCRHDEEPGCAIRKAVMAGQISPRRYQSYLRLQED
jgi:ribosome biogenesis GTPase / thiamine phosphate phosphatase